jgi:succinate dehydrogenase/fumarate reductase flavoprotein subunit
MVSQVHNQERPPATHWDEEVDVLVFGSGAGGLSAALYAEIAGLRSLLCEKDAQLGGTTASSGGIVWAPLSRHARQAGIKDSAEQVRLYLETQFGNTNNPELTNSFIESAAAAIDTLEENSEVKFNLAPWPDYYPDSKGGINKGRTLEAQRFDGRQLGKDFRLVRAPLKPLMLFGGMQVDKRKVDDFLNPFGSPSTFLRILKTFWRYGIDRLRYPRGTELCAGNALVAAFLYSLKKRKAAIWTNAPLVRLITDDGVVGAEVQTDGGLKRVRARRGVVLATGGFPHSKEMRERYSKDFPHEFAFGYEGNVGDGIQSALAIGASMDSSLKSSAYWQPSSARLMPDGRKIGVLYGYLDRGRPGIIAVDRHGKRFVNESNSYHHVGVSLFDAGLRDGNYFHFVCDRDFVWYHGLGLIRPFRWSLNRYIKDGYITAAPTLEDLAAKIGVDPVGLVETVSRHNRFAETGVDLDFGKGSTSYNRLFAHPRAKPNGNLAPIRKPPFIALRIYPGTLGTAVGIKANGNGQVLDKTGNEIRGLYACGNDMASVMRGAYPAGGITLGPAITFAYRAVQHMAKVTSLPAERLASK